VGVAVVPAAIVLAAAAPAQAAGPSACKSTGTATTTCVITWTGSVFSPASVTVQAGVAVEWTNQGHPLTGPGTLTITPGNKAPNQFPPIQLKPGQTSKPVAMSRTGTETVRGSQPISLIQTNVNTGTIKVVPRPVTPPPPPATSNPTSHTAHTTKPATGPAPPPPPAPPTGITNPPPLGAGAVPQPAPSPAGPGPVVAGPQPTPTPAAESPAATTDVPARALGQPVPARKYGLPGALAVVLLAGVAVGVVRLARVEYANGNGQHSMGGGIGPADESPPEPPR
jgi:hypothetical protein